MYHRNYPMFISFSVAFRIYDMDNDGFISNGELFQVLKMMVGNNLKDTQLQQIVDKTILFADKDEDGKISFEEFCNVSELWFLEEVPSFNLTFILGGRQHGHSQEDGRRRLVLLMLMLLLHWPLLSLFLSVLCTITGFGFASFFHHHHHHSLTLATPCCIDVSASQCHSQFLIFFLCRSMCHFPLFRFSSSGFLWSSVPNFTFFVLFYFIIFPFHLILVFFVCAQLAVLGLVYY